MTLFVDGSSETLRLVCDVKVADKRKIDQGGHLYTSACQEVNCLHGNHCLLDSLPLRASMTI